MNKKELVAAMSEETGITKADCERVLAAFVNTVTKSLKKKDPVQLIGFGTFDVSKRAARTGKNPQTGEAIKIPASIVPKFKPGKALKEAMPKK